jgi:hypothetical protein
MSLVNPILDWLIFLILIVRLHIILSTLAITEPIRATAQHGRTDFPDDKQARSDQPADAG